MDMKSTSKKVLSIITRIKEKACEVNLISDEKCRRNDSSINVTEVINKIREQVDSSQEERIKDGKSPLFRAQNIEIELSVIVSKSVEAKSGIDIKIVSLENRGYYRIEEIQKVKLTFRTLTRDEIIASGEIEKKGGPLSGDPTSPP